MPSRPAQRDINRVLAAETVSNFGSMLSRLAIPWLAALQLSATPAQMALLLVADVLAAALGALLLGPWVERRGKRAVMLLSDALRLLVLAALAWATWQGRITFGGLLLAAAASGGLGTAFELARSAWLAQRVPMDDLPRCNAQISVAGSLSETAAFAMGGWLYQGLGAALALLLDALSYGASALCLRGVAEAPPVMGAANGNRISELPSWRATIRSAWQDATMGLRTALAHSRLRAVLGIETLLGFGMALTGTVYTIFVTRDLGLPTGELGVIAALGGLGAVLGAAAAPAVGRRLGPGRAMALGLLALAAGTACLPMAQGMGWAAVAWLVAHQIVGDAGHTLHGVHDRTLRQTAVPPCQLARTDAGLRAAGHWATLAGAGVGAWVGSVADSRAVLWLAAASALAAAALAAVRLVERRGAC
jgi:Na+/melibiose symporter-like transporter